MGDDIYIDSYVTPPRSNEPPKPKTNETRIVEALESIASELFHIRRQMESVTDGGQGWGEPAGAIRTTGR